MDATGTSPKQATLVGSISQFGRTRDKVLCVCGHRNDFYRWSWAGHGKAKCAGCGWFISYRDLSVEPGTNQRKKRGQQSDGVPPKQ